MSCCDGIVVDKDYLCAVFAGFASKTVGVGAKFLMSDSAGNCGVATNLVQQSRFRFTVTAQPMVTATPLSVSWVIEDTDPLNVLVTVPGTTLTIPTGGAGMYEIDFSYTMASAPTSTVVNNAQIVIGGTAATAAGIARTYKQGNSLLADQHIHLGKLPLAAGDTILCQGIQSSGGSINMTSAIVTVTRIGS